MPVAPSAPWADEGKVLVFFPVFSLQSILYLLYTWQMLAKSSDQNVHFAANTTCSYSCLGFSMLGLHFERYSSHTVERMSFRSFDLWRCNFGLLITVERPIPSFLILATFPLYFIILVPSQPDFRTFPPALL